MILDMKKDCNKKKGLTISQCPRILKFAFKRLDFANVFVNSGHF